MEQEIVICEPLRTPVGAFGGAFKDVPATTLGARVVSQVLAKSGLQGEEVDSVLLGNVIQAGNGMNPARQASIEGGLPVSVPAMTINRVCGSGAQAVISGYAEIRAGLSQVVIAGGMENMDRAPYLNHGQRFGSRMGSTALIDAVLRDGLDDAFSGKHSGWHTEDLAARYRLTRQAQDAFAARSQQRFAHAKTNGVFDSQIVSVQIQGKKGVIEVSSDEANRADTTEETLARLRPAFRPDGTITAGNSPGVNAAAAAMLVTTRAFAEQRKLNPMLVVRGVAVAAVEPNFFGLGPIPAVRKALVAAGWTIDQVDLFEINEAFAAIALAVQLELDIDSEKLNIDGGAIAHGHPIGATGAVLLTKMAHALRRLDLRRDVVSLCIGGGQGVALCVERTD